MECSSQVHMRIKPLWGARLLCKQRKEDVPFFLARLFFRFHNTVCMAALKLCVLFLELVVDTNTNISSKTNYYRLTTFITIEANMPLIGNLKISLCTTKKRGIIHKGPYYFIINKPSHIIQSKLIAFCFPFRRIKYVCTYQLRTCKKYLLQIFVAVSVSPLEFSF